MACESVGQRRRGRDRVPGADRGPTVDGAQRRRVVALDEDAVADCIGTLEPQPDRAVEIERRPVAAEMQRVLVGGKELLLALELLFDQFFDCRDVHVEQRRQRADIDDILEQLALARIGVFAVGDRGQRHADDVDVVAEFRRRHRLGAVVEQISAGLDRGHVLVPGLRVHRHHEIGAAAGAEVSRFRDAHLVPGRQALDVGREDVARADRHAHAQEAAREQLVRRRRARAVDVGELDDEVVDRLDAVHAAFFFW